LRQQCLANSRHRFLSGRLPWRCTSRRLGYPLAPPRTRSRQRRRVHFFFQALFHVHPASARTAREPRASRGPVFRPQSGRLAFANLVENPLKLASLPHTAKPSGRPSETVRACCLARLIEGMRPGRRQGVIVQEGFFVARDNARIVPRWAN